MARPIPVSGACRPWLFARRGCTWCGWRNMPPSASPIEREWRRLKRDARSHLAPDLRAFVDAILRGLDHLGGGGSTILDEVPNWFLQGHRKPPTGRRAGRPVGAKDSYKRAPYRRKQNLPAPT
jgi:hypothetical protein